MATRKWPKKDHVNMKNAKNIEKIVTQSIEVLNSKDDPASWFVGQSIYALLQKSDGDPEKLLSEMQQLAVVLTEQRNSIAESLNLPQTEAPAVSMDARELLEELHELVRDTYTHWNAAAPAPNPELTGRLEKYATMKMPKADMLERLASTTIKRWDVMSQATAAAEDEPEYTLEVKLDRACGQLYVDVTPKGLTTPDQTENMPQLTVMVEVNNGLPCAHVFGDVYGDHAMTLFGRPGARLASRPGDAPVDYEDAGYSPDISEVIESIKKVASKTTNGPRDRMR